MKSLFIKCFLYFCLFSLLLSCFNCVYTNADDEINSKKVVYLTFDDGPSKNTPKILDILKENDVHATFFVICPYIEAHNALSEEAFWNNFNKHQNFLKEVTGKDCTIFRFPGGSHNTLVRNAHGSSFTENIILKLNEQGINCYDWNVDSGDAKGNNIPAATIYNNVVKESRDKNGELKSPAIVLMHDCMTKTTTVEALPKIIQYFKEQGYKFDTLN